MSSALLVIDVQRNMFEGTPSVYRGVELLATLSALVARARAAGMPVIFVRNCGAVGDVDEPGTEGWELSPALPRLVGEPIVDKSSPDAFVETNLDALLRARGVRSVIVCGLQSEYCVQATCRGARERGYEVTLASDGHSTFDSEGATAAEVIERENSKLSCTVRVAARAVAQN